MQDSNSDRVNKGGRKPTGTIQKTSDGRWRARITLADGTRRWLPPFAKGTSEAMAREKATKAAQDALRLGLCSTTAVKVDRRELAKRAKASCDAWVELWNQEREDRGLTSARDSKAHWETHLKATLGTKHPGRWTPVDFQRLSADLDVKVQASAISWKTASNIWGTATKMADDARNSKLSAIRCRADNPAEGVRGPYRGEKTARQYLYPSEFVQLMACDDVPLKWKRVVAVAIYSYARLGELRALNWDDVDLERGLISVTKAMDRTTGGLKSTKSKSPRLVPVEPELLQMLQAMFDERGQRVHVIDLPSERDMSRGLRRWLKRAGVNRPGLTASGPSVRPIRFHDMRATGLTWMAVRGDEPLRIQSRAGHTSFSTTQGYIREADVLRDGFGLPFPALPATVLAGVSSTGFCPPCGKTSGNIEKYWRGGRDSNPRPPA